MIETRSIFFKTRNGTKWIQFKWVNILVYICHCIGLSVHRMSIVCSFFIDILGTFCFIRPDKSTAWWTSWDKIDLSRWRFKNDSKLYGFLCPVLWQEAVSDAAIRLSVRLSHAIAQNRCILGRTLIGNPMLEVEPTGHQHRTRSPEVAEKATSCRRCRFRSIR